MCVKCQIEVRGEKKSERNLKYTLGREEMRKGNVTTAWNKGDVAQFVGKDMPQT